MYKVFIVEDEHLIRDNLRHQIISLAEKYPIIYSNEAADGELALASISLTSSRYHFDGHQKCLFMDGLTFAKRGQKKLFATLFELFLLAASMILITQKQRYNCKLMTIC